MAQRQMKWRTEKKKTRTHPTSPCALHLTVEFRGGNKPAIRYLILKGPLIGSLLSNEIKFANEVPSFNTGFLMNKRLKMSGRSVAIGDGV